MSELEKEKINVQSASSCCGGEVGETTLVNGDIRETVQHFYANRVTDRCGCGDQSKVFYSEEFLEKVPEEISSYSMGCGNPISAANMVEGEVVLDLGSGAGLDCFLSAKEVGEAGYVIGIDMTPEMLERSTEAAKKMGFDNVVFRKGYLEEMPVDDNSIDVVISNCVINLSPDKSLVFNEIARVLKPGGRIAVSDIVINGEIPEEVLALKDSWSSCAAGALSIEAITIGLKEAGLGDVEIIAKTPSGDLLDENPENELFSAIIKARKPA